MVEEREVINTYRPDGKKGITMLRTHYDQMTVFILSLLDSYEDITLNILLEKARQELTDSIDSDIAWCILQVKLDLEARDYIRVVSPPYNKHLFFLRITRQGQKMITLRKTA